MGILFPSTWRKSFCVMNIEAIPRRTIIRFLVEIVSKFVQYDKNDFCKRC